MSVEPLIDRSETGALATLADDAELCALIDTELRFQQSTINLIAASNYVSPAVGQAMPAALGNIHCEGYPGKRYHQGQDMADAIERLAIERACALFGADHANVQSYRGTMANLAACMAAATPGDTILGFACDGGGHYSTGGAVHLTGKLFAVETYTVDPTTYELDYEAIAERAETVRPRVIFSGDTAYPGEWNWPRLREIADSVGAALVADISQTAGLIATGNAESPVPWADIVTMATYKTLRGPRSGLILCTDEYAARVDRAVHPVCQDGTSVTAIAGLAAALYEASQSSYRAYCRAVLTNAAALARELGRRGYDLVTGGTANHACLIDLRGTGWSGRDAAASLEAVNILCNANQVPYDPGPPANPSGLRVGTAAVTTLGMTSEHMQTLAAFIDRALQRPSEIDRMMLADEVSSFRWSFNTIDLANDD